MKSYMWTFLLCRVGAGVPNSSIAQGPTVYGNAIGPVYGYYILQLCNNFGEVVIYFSKLIFFGVGELFTYYILHTEWSCLQIRSFFLSNMHVFLIVFVCCCCFIELNRILSTMLNWSGERKYFFLVPYYKRNHLIFH